MAIERKGRLSLEVEQELIEELKALAARKGKSLNQFCVDLLEQRVEIDKTGYVSPLEELWDNEDDAVYDDDAE
jgi:hypothetical protein